MKLKRYIEIIKEFAAADPDLQHNEETNPAVFSVDVDEAVSLLSNITDRMILLVPPYEKYVRENRAMGNVWMKQCLIMAFQYVPVEDRQAKIDVETKSEEVLDRLYHYLFHHRNTEELYGFDTNLWQTEPIGPVGSNSYGYAVEFVIKDGVLL